MRKQAKLLSVLLVMTALAYPVCAQYTDAISREFSVYIDPGPEPTDAISREFSVYAGSVPVMMAKHLPNAREVSLTDAAVSAKFPGYFYLESLNKSSGVRVQWPNSVDVGDKLDVTGTTGTTSDFERYVLASSVTSSGAAEIKPLGVKNPALGGGDFFYDALTGAGQRGITGAFGLNNIGLLARIVGRVTASGSYPRGTWFYVDDGSGVDDGTGVKGIYAEAPASVTPPAEGAFAVVTGVSSCEFYMDKLVNMLRVRDPDDVIVVQESGGQSALVMGVFFEEKTPPRLAGR